MARGWSGVSITGASVRMGVISEDRLRLGVWKAVLLRVVGWLGRGCSGVLVLIRHGGGLRRGATRRHARHGVRGSSRISRVSVVFEGSLHSVVATLSRAATITTTLCWILSVFFGRSHILGLCRVEESRIIPSIVTRHPSRQVLVRRGVWGRIGVIVAGGRLDRGLRICRLAVVYLLTVRILRHGFGGVRVLTWCRLDSARLDAPRIAQEIA